MKLEADLDVCIGSGMCAMTNPEVFEQDPDDGRVVLRTDCVSRDHRELVEEAVANCPSQALSLHPDERA